MAETRRKYWRKLIAEQQASGQKALPFCREHESHDIRFTSGVNGCGKAPSRSSRCWKSRRRQVPPPDSALELILRNGERLRIGNQVAAETLRMVLEAVRG